MAHKRIEQSNHRNKAALVREQLRPNAIGSLCSLEDYDNDTKRATKAAIFRERTIQRSQRRQIAESAHDALVLSLNEVGRVDLARVGTLLLRTPDEFLPELKGLIYLNPETQRWEENVTALEAVQPEDLGRAVTTNDPQWQRQWRRRLQ